MKIAEDKKNSKTIVPQVIIVFSLKANVFGLAIGDNKRLNSI